jgi:hypothetical protein
MPKRLLVTFDDSSADTQVLQAGTVGGSGGTIAMPPTRSGKLSLMVRGLDAAGNESAASAAKVIHTRVDRTKPRIRRVTAKRVARGVWKIAWSRPVDDDRVIVVIVQSRTKHSKAWRDETSVACIKCMTHANAHIALSTIGFSPDAYQFRVIPIDRAYNFGHAVIAK